MPRHAPIFDELSFFSWLNKQGKSEQTLYAYVKYVRAELSRKDPLSFLKRDLSRSSKTVIRAAMTAYAQWSKNAALLSRLSDIQTRKAVNSAGALPPRATKQLDEEEIKSFLSVLERHRGHEPEWVWPLISIMYKCALRAGSDLLNLSKKAIRQGIETGELPIYTKGERYRIVPAEVVKSELDYLVRLKWESVADLICPDIKEASRASCYQRVNEAVKIIAQKAGIDPKAMHTHRLRHTRAMELYNQGHDVHLVQKLLGHASIETTQVYLKSNRTSEMVDAMKKIDEGRGRK